MNKKWGIREPLNAGSTIMNHELVQSNFKINNDVNDDNNNNTITDNTSDSEEDMKLAVADSHPTETNGEDRRSSNSSRTHSHSKTPRKEKSERSSSKRSMDDVLKRLSKYNCNHENNQDNNQNLLTSAIDLAELATASNDRRNIEETEQKLTLMIEQLQHLRHKLVSQQQVSVISLFFSSQ